MRLNLRWDTALRDFQIQLEPRVSRREAASHHAPRDDGARPDAELDDLNQRKKRHELENYQPRRMSSGTRFQSQIFLQLFRLARRFAPLSGDTPAREVRGRSKQSRNNRFIEWFNERPCLIIGGHTQSWNPTKFFYSPCSLARRWLFQSKPVIAIATRVDRRRRRQQRARRASRSLPGPVFAPAAIARSDRHNISHQWARARWARSRDFGISAPI